MIARIVVRCRVPDSVAEQGIKARELVLWAAPTWFRGLSARLAVRSQNSRHDP